MKPNRAGEANRPQDPEIVFLEPLSRVSHGAHQTPVEISGAIERIPPLTAHGMVGHRVDREVAAGQVLLQRCAIRNNGVAPIRRYVAPERGDLVQDPVPVEHAHRAVLDPDRHRAGEELLHLLRGSGGGDIEIGVRVPQQLVAQRPADAPGLEPGALERLDDLQNGLGNFQLGGEGHGQPPYGAPAETAIVNSIRA